jgi:hypothetical protein
MQLHTLQPQKHPRRQQRRLHLWLKRYSANDNNNHLTLTLTINMQPYTTAAKAPAPAAKAPAPAAKAPAAAAPAAGGKKISRFSPNYVKPAASTMDSTGGGVIAAWSPGAPLPAKVGLSSIYL